MASGKLTSDVVMFHIGAILLGLLFQWALGADYIVLYPDHRQDQIYEAMDFVPIIFILQALIVVSIKYCLAYRKKRTAIKLIEDVEAAPGRMSCSTKPSVMNAIVAHTMDLAKRFANPALLARVIRLERDNLNALYQNEYHQEQQSTEDQLARAEMQLRIADQVALVAQLLNIESATQEAATELGAEEREQRRAARRERRERRRLELQELYDSCTNCRAAIDAGARNRREIRQWIRARKANPETEPLLPRD